MMMIFYPYIDECAPEGSQTSLDSSCCWFTEYSKESLLSSSSNADMHKNKHHHLTVRTCRPAKFLQYRRCVEGRGASCLVAFSCDVTSSVYHTYPCKRSYSPHFYFVLGKGNEAPLLTGNRARPVSYKSHRTTCWQWLRCFLMTLLMNGAHLDSQKWHGHSETKEKGCFIVQASQRRVPYFTQSCTPHYPVPTPQLFVFFGVSSLL